jgi:hypothetical protein
MFDDEGMSYVLLHKISPESISDEKGRELAVKAHDALKELGDYVVANTVDVDFG